MAAYTIGLDYGTLSARALICDTADGRELACVEYAYPHGVMDSALPCGVALGRDWALQHPKDYIDAFVSLIPQVLAKAGVSGSNVIALGVDFTASSPMPVKRDGTPLCMIIGLESEPHAYVKLWKHHASQPQADRINGRGSGSALLMRYGGKISSEWMIPKLLQIYEESPETFTDADIFIEAGDWLVWQLCGVMARNSCAAGYKGMWSAAEGYPGREFFTSLYDFKSKDEADIFASAIVSKLDGNVIPIGGRQGGLTSEMAKLTGLQEGIPVAACVIDAHAAVPGAGIGESGRMLAIIGTSTCHLIVDEKEQLIKGICGVAENGILPGFYGYEAGQGCVGDLFAWFCERCVPSETRTEAEASGMGIHAFLRVKATKLKAGESGLVALDWWNGNRCPYANAELSGVIVGLTLSTRPEAIYRALLEATAFGTRAIIENLRDGGIAVNEFIATGGIAKKDPLMMQIYADVIGMKVRIAESEQGGARGSAVFAAAAAGKAAGGWDSISEAAEKMGALGDTVYTPDATSSKIYDRLYKEYKILAEYYGENSDMMRRLRSIRQSESK